MTSIDWHALDWSLSNGALARAHGIGEKRVQVKRIELRKPKSTNRLHSPAKKASFYQQITSET